MSGVSRIGSPGPRPPFPGPQSVAGDIRLERRALRRGPFPRGENRVNLRNTWRFRHDPLHLLLEGYQRYGPVFGMRVMFGLNVFMIGPEANHFVLVSGRENFTWRDGRMGDLLTLIGDGLLTTDGDYHDASRAIMMPAFHRERVALAAEAMTAEAAAAGDGLDGNAGVDVYHWTRDLAMRIAMRALFGFDPDSGRAHEIASRFESGLSFHGREFPMQLLVGPGSPYDRLKRDRAELERLVGAEISKRRARGEDSGDMLGSLLAASDEEGRALSNRQVLDHVLTLLFAGHDTTTSTVTFLVYELARSPEWTARLAAERDEVCGDREPTPEELFGRMPLLTRAVDETLRLYPPAWIGPRRALSEFELHGHRVPAGVPVNYSSWASHRLPDVWEDPHAFRPERFLPGEREKIPRGAYVPFGGGSRICLGMRFGQLEIGVIAAAIRERFTLERLPGHRLEIRQTPTLGPRGGLPMRVRTRRQ
jgi:cytochrome P450